VIRATKIAVFAFVALLNTTAFAQWSVWEDLGGALKSPPSVRFRAKVIYTASPYRAAIACCTSGGTQRRGTRRTWEVI
jgi:hypothetical protein